MVVDLTALQDLWSGRRCPWDRRPSPRIPSLSPWNSKHTDGRGHRQFLDDDENVTRSGAAVAVLTDSVDLAGWPSGTRIIVCREPPHPGAQEPGSSLAYRYRGHRTRAW